MPVPAKVELIKSLLNIPRAEIFKSQEERPPSESSKVEGEGDDENTEFDFNML